MFAARHFRPFLPPPGQELGQPWWIIPGELSVFTGYLSNNRFYPPPPKDKEVRAGPGEAGPTGLAQRWPFLSEPGPKYQASLSFSVPPSGRQLTDPGPRVRQASQGLTAAPRSSSTGC